MEREEFMYKYYNEHCFCPKCHSKNYSTTLLGIIFYPDNSEEYKDINNVKCYTCGWKGKVHDLVPKSEKIAFQVALFNEDRSINYDCILRNHDDAKELVDKLSKESGDYYYFYAVEIKD